jgi:hypothetical protein
MNTRVSKKHGFYVIKSKQKQEDGKQAPRRKMYIFEQEYVTYDKKIGNHQEESDFDSYLKQIHEDSYVSLEESLSTFVIQQNDDDVQQNKIQDNVSQEFLQSEPIEEINEYEKSFFGDSISDTTPKQNHKKCPNDNNVPKKNLENREKKLLEQARKELEDEETKFRNMQAEYEKKQAAKEAFSSRAQRREKRKVTYEKIFGYQNKSQ